MTTESRPLSIKQIMGDPEAARLRRAAKALPNPINAGQAFNLLSYDALINKIQKPMSWKERWESLEKHPTS